MNKIKQYLPFVLWSISTIILTIVAFAILPVLLVWEKLKGSPSHDEVCSCARCFNAA